MDIRKIDYEHVEQALADYRWIKIEPHEIVRIEKYSISGREVHGILLRDTILLRGKGDSLYREFKFEDISLLQIDSFSIEIIPKDCSGCFIYRI